MHRLSKDILHREINTPTFFSTRRLVPIGVRRKAALISGLMSRRTSSFVFMAIEVKSLASEK